MYDFFYILLEADQTEITWWAMAFRGVFAILWGIILIKIGGKRMFGKEGAFDIVISIILGAILSRGVSGNAKFIPTLITVVIMVAFYNLLSRITFYNRFMAKIIKGDTIQLIKDGKANTDAVKEHRVSYDDILEVQRLKNHSVNPEKIEEAYLEANGKLSVILKWNEQ